MGLRFYNTAMHRAAFALPQFAKSVCISTKLSELQVKLSEMFGPVFLTIENSEFSFTSLYVGF